MKKLGAVIAQMAAAGIAVAIWSNQRWTVTPENTPLEDYLSALSGVEVPYVGMQVGMPARQRAGSVNPILQKFNVRLEEVLLVGATEADLQAGVNNKLLLLRPAWYGGTLSYGFELRSIEELARFCLLFGTRVHPFYWSVQDESRGVHVNALGPFSTMIEAYAKFGEDARDAAKYERGTLEFWHQLISSTLYFSGLIHSVDLIAVYPGHKAQSQHKAFHEVLDLLGKCFGKTFFCDLLVRHTDAEKSTYKRAAERRFQSQIETLKINRFPSKYGRPPRKTPLSLQGKCVLVVDDICTSGRSLDTARVFLTAAGARVVMFAWLKTINTEFLSMQPAPRLLPYGENKQPREPTTHGYGYASNIVDAEAATEIHDLLNKYQNWRISA